MIVWKVSIQQSLRYLCYQVKFYQRDWLSSCGLCVNFKSCLSYSRSPVCFGTFNSCYWCLAIIRHQLLFNIQGRWWSTHCHWPGLLSSSFECKWLPPYRRCWNYCYCQRVSSAKLLGCECSPGVSLISHLYQNMWCMLGLGFAYDFSCMIRLFSAGESFHLHSDYRQSGAYPMWQSLMIMDCWWAFRNWVLLNKWT